MKLRLLALNLAMVCIFLCGMFTACVPAPSSAPAEADSILVTVMNGSDYQFVELYVSPTAAEEWGEDHLGSTNVLKRGGSYDIVLPAYDYNTYDVKVVDEDDDIYLFSRVLLEDGSELAIGFGENGLEATISYPDGSSEVILGELVSSAGGAGGEDGAGGAAPAPVVTGTGNDTNGLMEFTVYNESDYDIYAIHVGIADASADADIDVLPEILPAHSSTIVRVVASQGDWLNTEWTMYVTDVEGDTSTSYETFNPWVVSYVNIYWDTDSHGYICDFVYE